ncbi:MAG: O-antigen ligase family protein [Armatimonadota bacterium]
MSASFDHEASRALFLVAHAVFGVLLMEMKFLGLVHAAIVVLLGLRFASRPASTPATVGLLSYLVASEVLWRVSGMVPSWEFAKYAFAAVCGVALLRRRSQTLIGGLALLYFILLIPATSLTLSQLPLGVARREIAFNLSGPLALSMGIMYFSGIRISQIGLQRALFTFAGPVVALLAAAAYHMASFEAITFNSEAMDQASAGFGPNQVSVLLGLGMLSLVVYLLTSRETMRMRIVIGTMAVGMLIQGLLTFARAGTGAAIISLLAVGLFLARSRRHRISLGLLFAGSLLFVQILIPVMNEYTGGMLQQRYQEVSHSRREIMILADLRVWEEHPLFGSGVGLAKAARSEVYGTYVTSHTEYSRLVAEHGSLGFVSLGILAFLAVYLVFRAPSGLFRAVTVGLVLSAVIYMGTNGMRLAVPAFLLGIVSCQWYTGSPSGVPRLLRGPTLAGEGDGLKPG